VPVTTSIAGIDDIGAMLSCAVLRCRLLTACATVEQEKRLRAEVEHLEEDTGIKLRVLCQNYPQTPGKPSLHAGIACSLTPYG
jgi:hypothetical protein